MDPTEAERRRELQRLRYFDRPDDKWNPGLLEAYHHALDDLPPVDIAAAIDEAIRTRAVRPKANQVRDAALTAARARRETSREGRERVFGEGRGCPRCRAEYGEQGTHPRWVGDGSLICCTAHNVMWRGTTHQPDDDTLAVSHEVWREAGKAGDYGHVIEAIAAWGGGPASIAQAVAGDLAAEVREETTSTPAAARAYRVIRQTPPAKEEAA